MCPVCDQCECEIPGGEVVVLEGSVLCAACGWQRAAFTLEAFFHPYYSPLELRAREYAEAWRAMEALRAQVQARMREVGAVASSAARAS